MAKDNDVFSKMAKARQKREDELKKRFKMVKEGIKKNLLMNFDAINNGISINPPLRVFKILDNIRTAVTFRYGTRIIWQNTIETNETKRQEIFNFLLSYLDEGNLDSDIQSFVEKCIKDRYDRKEAKGYSLTLEDFIRMG